MIHLVFNSAVFGMWLGKLKNFEFLKSKFCYFTLSMTFRLRKIQYFYYQLLDYKLSVAGKRVNFGVNLVINFGKIKHLKVRWNFSHHLPQSPFQKCSAPSVLLLLILLLKQTESSQTISLSSAKKKEIYIIRCRTRNFN